MDPPSTVHNSSVHTLFSLVLPVPSGTCCQAGAVVEGAAGAGERSQGQRPTGVGLPEAKLAGT